MYSHKWIFVDVDRTSMRKRVDSLKKRAREMYSRKWIFVDVDKTPRRKMRQMYYLCTDMKRGYVRDRWGDVGLWPAYQDRPHVVMFFSEVQPDFKILSLCKWDVRMLSSNKQELDRYDGATQKKK